MESVAVFGIVTVGMDKMFVVVVVIVMIMVIVVILMVMVILGQTDTF